MLLKLSAPEDKIIVFHTKNSPHMAYASVIELLQSNRSIQFEKCYEGNNGLDFQLISYLGYLMKDDAIQDSEFIVMSNDTGFDCAVRFWRDRGFPVNRINVNYCKLQIQKQKDKEKKASSMKATADLNEQKVQGVQAADEVQDIQISSEVQDVLKVQTASEAQNEPEVKVLPEVQNESEAQVLPEMQNEPEVKDVSEALNEPEVQNVTEGQVLPAEQNVTEVQAVTDAQMTPEVQNEPEVQAMPEVQNVSEALNEPEAQNATETEVLPEVQDAAELQTVPEVQIVPERQNVPSTEAVSEVSKIQEKDEAAPQYDFDKKQVDLFINCIGRGDLIKIHETLVHAYGQKQGQSIYKTVKDKSYPFKEEKYSRKEKVKHFADIIFANGSVDNPGDFVEFLEKNKDKTKNLNSIRAAIIKSYGTENGNKYYSLFKPYFKIISALK